jgi:hypothetical protein
VYLCWLFDEWNVHRPEDSLVLPPTLTFLRHHKAEYKYVTEELGSEGMWSGSVVAPHYAMIRSFLGTLSLSPTEAIFVLMHALSSDTRLIYVFALSFFDEFYDDVHDTVGIMENEDIPQELLYFLREWKVKLYYN